MVLPTGNTFSNSTYDFLNIGTNSAVAEYYYDKTQPNSQLPSSFFGIKIKKTNPSDHCNNPKPPQLINDDEAFQNEQKYLNHLEKFQFTKEAYENALINSDTSQTNRLKLTKFYEKRITNESVTYGYNYAKNILKNRDATRIWIRRFNNITGDYLLANDYFSNGEYNQGLNVISNIFSKYNLTEEQIIDFEQVQYIYQKIIEQGIDNLDSSVIQDLEFYAESEKGKSCFIARTVLRNYNKYYPPIIPNHPTKVDFPNTNLSNSEEHKKMMVFPNPADFNITFDWQKFHTLNRKVIIKITNQSGQLIDILEPTIGKTNLEWTTELVNSGKCYYSLIIDNQEVDSGQIIINK